MGSMLEAHESVCMKTPAPLLFLELEGVLVLGGSKKRELVADAVSNIARGDSNWRDHQGTWEGLFAAEPVRQLKALHDQFQLRYCLTTNWTGLLDKAATLNVLRLSGLGFVASNLHARWEVDRGLGAVRRSDQIEAGCVTIPISTINGLFWTRRSEGLTSCSGLSTWRRTQSFAVVMLA